MENDKGMPIVLRLFRYSMHVRPVLAMGEAYSHRSVVREKQTYYWNIKNFALPYEDHHW